MLSALLIDDNEEFLAALAEVVEQEGIEVTLARSLQEAKGHLKRSPADVRRPEGSTTAMTIRCDGSISTAGSAPNGNF